MFGRTTTILALVALGALALACSSTFEEKELPEISVALAGGVGETVYTFNNIEIGKKATAEVTIQNIGKKDLEIQGFRFGEMKTDEGVASGGQFVLTNDVADAATVTVWRDGDRCDEGWELDEPRHTIVFAPEGDCAVEDALSQVEVEYHMVPNPAMSLNYKGKNAPTADAPFVLEPKEVNPYKSFDFALEYDSTEAGETGDLVLIIDSNDPKTPEVTLTFTVSAPSSKARIYPSKFDFLNPSYDYQDFSIYNDGNADLVFHGVRWQSESEHFDLQDWPNNGAIVPPGGQPLTFRVTYEPGDGEPEMNAVLVATNDPLYPETAVSISAKPREGVFEVKHANSEHDPFTLDFSEVAAGLAEEVVTFRVLGQSECEGMGVTCGGSVRIEDVNVDPASVDVAVEDVQSAYSWVMRKLTGPNEYQVITDQDTKDALWQAQKFLYSVPSEQTVEIVVTYNADVFLAGMNGLLVLNYSTPNKGDYTLNLFGGDSKPLFDAAPNNYQLHYNTNGNEAKTLNAMLYNNGNGPMTITEIKVRGEWSDESSDFVLAAPELAGGAELAPYSMLAVPIQYQYISGDVGGDGNPASIGFLEIHYPESVEPETFQLHGHPDLTVTPPVATPVVDGSVIAGNPVTLDGNQSTPSPDAEIYEFIWYLSKKPDGSKVKLNTRKEAAIDAGRVSFIPDQSGSYEVSLIVYNVVGAAAIFSDPAVLTVTVP